ncbi:ABC transporter permease [Foetidibacter luteolus]|uniref:ABC transporter permease n=1 Tax=Foetidibacter luteolus TaxID=2608880 RepID=UPI00129A2C42|nr:ABC transporter permease [Foetidibacter luteolus]
MPTTTFYNTAFWKRLRKNRGAVAGLAVILLAVIVAVFAYYIAPDKSPYANRIIPEIANQKPGFSIYFLRHKKNTETVHFLSQLINGQPDVYEYVPVSSYKKIADSIIAEKYIDEGVTERLSVPAPAANIVQQKFYLGTDKFGRDILSRLVVGVRVSLSVGLIAVIISLTIGIFLGAVAGYFRGKADNMIMWLINVVWSIPVLLLVFAITLLLGKGFWQVFIAVGLTMWVNVARLVRGQVLAVRDLEYVDAARVLGFSPARIIAVHILPNILGPVLVIAAGNFASAIVIEAGLSFLGVGVQPPQPSWGLMIKENYNFIITSNPVLALAPGIAIMVLVLAFNLLGNGLRDALNVRGKI